MEKNGLRRVERLYIERQQSEERLCSPSLKSTLTL